MNSPLTPLSFLDRSVSVYPDKIAVVEGERRWTYQEFGVRVHRLAAALQHAGVASGDRVAVLAHNSPAALEPHFGVPLTGALLVMLNFRLQPAELAWILKHCEAKVLISQPDLLDPLRPYLGDIPHLTLATSNYEEFLATGRAEDARRVSSREDDRITINYTSGTTGFPKGVVFTHRGAWINAMGEIAEMGLTADSVYLWTLPLFHCNGWCFPWAVTAAGGRQVLLSKVEAERILQLIEAENVTHLCGAPVVVNTIAQHCLAHGLTLPHKVRIMTAGAPPSPAVLRAAALIGADMLHVYGLTETYGPYSICAWRGEWDQLPLEQQAVLKARQGVPYVINGTDLRVVDEYMQDVPLDAKAMGEVIMRGNNVMLEYFRNPEATEEAFRGGWFHSGDLAVRHADGYIEIRDRQKDIIISGGENISSVEVEKTICDHPAVLEAAVFSVPDDRWGEVPKALVTLKDGHEATAAGILEFCRGRLAHFKCPRHIEFGLLPKTATGKIRKNELRNNAWAGREKRVN